MYLNKMNFKVDLNNHEPFHKLISHLDNPDVTYANFVKKLAKHHFHVKAIIQVSITYLQVDMSCCLIANLLRISLDPSVFTNE